jgi:predicted dehydrogenase
MTETKRPGTTLRFAAIGAGFWAPFQLSAWKELEGAECIALCDRDRGRAEALAAKLGISAVYDDAEAMLRRERPDFVDIITSRKTHPELVRLAASLKVPCICQKPLASSPAEARELAEACRRSGVPLFVHENWRWQKPIRELKKVLDAGTIGAPFRARIEMVSGFPVFENQPYLKDEEKFLVADMGIHILDTARFLFGEAATLYCETHQVHRDIRGEDVATVMMSMGAAKTTVVCSMGFPESPLERDCFPQTSIFVEGERGSVELAPDYWLRVTTADGTHSRRCPPPIYPWLAAAYAVAQSSLVDCNADMLRAFRSGGLAETHAGDNLKTLELTFDAYTSASERRVLHYGAPPLAARAVR